MWRSTVLLIIASLFPYAAHAEFACGGPLTDSEVVRLDNMLNPAYGPNLSKSGSTVSSGDFSKRLTAEQLKLLRNDKLRVAASRTLDKSEAILLKNMLNAHASSSVPGWFPTIVGTFAPAAWMGITADVIIQLANGAKDAGRLLLANVAGTVAPGGEIAALERVGKDASGNEKFIWAYTYTAVLNGRPTASLLYACAADIVMTP